MLSADKKNGIMKAMETIIKKIDKNQIDEDAIREAGEILREGGLVAFPTETVYGLGANALDEEAAKKTYEAKGRPSDNPLIVHIADLEDLSEITENVPPETELLAKHFWPGPLTMIFEKSSLVPYGTTGGLDTVAVRMPSDLIARKLILAAGGYVSAPSANTSGRPSPTTAEHVWEDLNGKIEMIIDGGSVDIGLESTILDMTVSPPMILRPGAITADMLEEVIGVVSVDETILGSESSQAPKAPGMKYRHYAPKAKLTIVEGSLKEEVFAIRQLAYEKSRQGVQVGIIGTNETVEFYTHGLVKNIGSRENEKTIARNLYRILREFDEEDVSEIYSESFATPGNRQCHYEPSGKGGRTLQDPRISSYERAKIQKNRICQQYRYLSRTGCGRDFQASVIRPGILDRIQGNGRFVSRAGKSESRSYFKEQSDDAGRIYFQTVYGEEPESGDTDPDDGTGSEGEDTF